MRYRAAALASLCATLASAQSPTAETTESLVVTGTRLPRAEAQSAQDIRTYDRERIERSGSTTVADFLAKVPEVSLNSNESTFIATSIRLRGAREGSTLVLVNGHRTQAITGDAAPFGFFDINTIPLSMVERIDILPTGSSAIYGGEALAGVVNIVLRSGFTGFEGALSYKSAKNTDEKLVYAGAGWKSDFAAVSIMGSYSDRSSMQGKDREITSNPDLRRFGGPNLGSVFFGVPATIFSVTGNLPGLNSNVATVPAGSSGVGLRPSDFAATAGQQNTGSFSRYQELIPNSIRYGVFASGEYRLRTIDLFAEVLASKFKMDLAQTPPFLLQAVVPATNAFNPFGTAVRAAGVVQGGEPFTRLRFDDEYVRPLVGARGRFGADWSWEATALYSRDRGTQDQSGQPNAAALAAALASSDPATALNPFVDGPMGSAGLLASIYTAHSVTTWIADATLLNAFTRGPVMRLPAGTLDVVVGAEHEHSKLERGLAADRNVKAFFTELRAPLFSAGNGSAKREVLAVQGAVRRDDYSDFGGKTTWQAGIEYRPVSSVLLRGTHGTAFKPPTLYNIGAPLNTFASSFRDPRRNGETVVGSLTQGGNPGLAPTTGDSSTVGVLWSPRGFHRLNVSVTGWRLRIDNAINLPSGQSVVDNEALFAGRVTRGPAAAGDSVGPIVAVDARYINFGTMKEEGIDAAADCSFTTAAGEFIPNVAATYMTKFTGANAPGGADVNRLSHANADGIFAPRVKATASLGWNPNAILKLGVTGRYVGRYYDYTPTHVLGNFWYLDGFVEADLERAFGKGQGSLMGARVIVAGTNLADKLPTWAMHFRGYDVYNYDLVGRTILVRLQLRT